MTTFKPNVDSNTVDQAWQSVAANAKLDSSAVDVVSSGKGSFLLNFKIGIGRQSTTAFTANGLVVYLLLSKYLSTDSNDEWVHFPILQPAVGASIANPTLGANTSAAATQLTVSANTNISLRELLFLTDGTAANSELVEVARINSTTLDCVPPLKNSHLSGIQIYGQGIFASGTVDLQPWKRFKFIVDNRGNGVGIYSRVEWNQVQSYDGT